MNSISSQLDNILNKEQKEAVQTINGPLLVLAGAGTGKTRVITYRIAYMIEQGIPASEILGVTFTNKAAKEMKKRLESIVSSTDAEKVFLGTFHSFCARFLRREITSLGYMKNFTICDDADQKGIIKQVMAELNIHKDMIDPGLVLYHISSTKSSMLDPTETVVYNTALSHIFPELYRRYNTMLKNQNMVDFDDLLLLTAEILKENSEVLEKYHNKYKYILVDEYQDTNTLQFFLLRKLAEKHNNICVVGDDDQSIYGWRGAKIENILNFPALFPGAKKIKLEQNYRSTNNILNAANAIISKNEERHEKKLWSNCGEGEKINIITASNELEEANFVADAVSKLSGAAGNFKDTVILYRSNHLSRLIEESMRRNRIPYKLIGAKSFYDRKEIRDAAAYLKLIVNKYDDQSLQRILSAPPRGIGTKSIELLRKMQSVSYLPMTELLVHEDFLGKVSRQAAASAVNLIETFSKWRAEFKHTDNLSESAYEYLKEIGYINGLIRMYKKREEAEKRLDNVKELINAIFQFQSGSDANVTLADFLESYSLTDMNDKEENNGDTDNAVSLMTVHAAKGLEFDNVFIIAAEENIFPNERALNEKSEEEERRLFYVALTRARKKLFITRARKRNRFGQTLTRARRSRFLKELPEDIISEKLPEDVFEPVSFEEMKKAFENFTF